MHLTLRIKRGTDQHPHRTQIQIQLRTQTPPGQRIGIKAVAGSDHNRSQRAHEYKAQQDHIDNDITHARNHRISKAIRALEHKHINSNLLPHKNQYLTSTEFNAIYNDLYSIFTLESLPFTHIDELHIHHSCLPPNHDESEENICKISTFLYQRLSQTIDASLTKFRGLITPSGHRMDGYEALFAIASNSLSYLRPTATGWGPAWSPDDEPGSYAGKLIEFIRHSRLSRQHTYTELDQSFKLLHK